MREGLWPIRQSVKESLDLRAKTTPSNIQGAVKLPGGVCVCVCVRACVYVCVPATMSAKILTELLFHNVGRRPSLAIVLPSGRIKSI